VEAIRERVRQFWGRLGAWQRAALVSGVVLAAAAVVVAFAARGQEYVPLFTDLQPADAGDVVARLEEDGIPYRFSGDGRTILVPGDQVHRLRLMLAAEGLPTGGVVGMEVMDQFQFGATEFERRMNRLRALQGELTRTIRQVEGVEDARVHIVLPEESLFISQRQPASAAVLVRMKPGRTLSAEQVAAITYLVAGSVEGLEPEAVTIVDSNGTVMSTPGSAGARGAALRHPDPAGHPAAVPGSASGKRPVPAGAGLRTRQRGRAGGGRVELRRVGHRPRVVRAR